MLNRKQNRLTRYDYAQQGYYFITICTENKMKILWKDDNKYELSAIGASVEKSIRNIERCYQNVKVEKYVIMPNHVHIILQIMECDKEQQAPSISRIIKQTKMTATKVAGRSIWQKSFYDHVIRNEQDYLEKWKYIDENPAKWISDDYYVE